MHLVIYGLSTTHLIIAPANTPPPNGGVNHVPPSPLCNSVRNGTPAVTTMNRFFHIHPVHPPTLLPVTRFHMISARQPRDCMKKKRKRSGGDGEGDMDS